MGQSPTKTAEFHAKTPLGPRHASHHQWDSSVTPAAPAPAECGSAGTRVPDRRPSVHKPLRTAQRAQLAFLTSSTSRAKCP